MVRERFTEGELGDGGGARVPKWGEAMATGGAPYLRVGVSRLFLFTALMWEVSRIAIVVTKLGNTNPIGCSTLGTSRHLGWTDSSSLV